MQPHTTKFQSLISLTIFLCSFSLCSLNSLGVLTALAIFSECIAAFWTTHKLGRGFIRAPSLHKPNISSIVSAPWAFNAYRWQSVKLCLLLADYRHHLLCRMLNYSIHEHRLFPSLLRLLKSAFMANKPQCYFLCRRFLRCQTGTAVWAKLHP